MARGIPRNIDYFHVFAADIMVRLYSAFPVPEDLDFEAFDFEGIFPDEDRDRLAKIWAHSVRWLRSEGIIRVDAAAGDGDDQFLGVVLTEKGFRILNRPTDLHANLKLGESLAISMNDPVTETGRNHIREQVDEIFGGGDDTRTSDETGN